MQPRDVGEIRCTASVSGKGPSISCAAELRLNRAARNPEDSIQSATNGNRNEKPPNCNSLRKTRKDVPPPVESPTRASRSSSLPRRSTPSPNLSPLPVRRNIPPSPLLLDRRKLADKTGKRKDLNLKKFARKATQRVYREPGDRVSSDEEEAKETFETKLLENEGEFVKENVRKTDKSDTRQIQDNVNKHDNTPIICVKHVPEEMEEIEEESSIQNDAIVMEKEENIVGGEEELVAACIVKVPADVTVFRGNRVVLRVTYRGHPEPMVKWLRAVNIYIVYMCSSVHSLVF